MKTILLLSFFCISAFLEANSTSLLTFQRLTEFPASAIYDLSSENIPQELKEFHHQQIRIRGFLYTTKEGRTILAAEPNLRTCCVGSANAISRQIFIQGNSLPSKEFGEAVLLEGKFVIDPLQDKHGNWLHLFILEDASLIVEEKRSQFWPLIGLCALFVSITGFILFHRKKH